MISKNNQTQVLLNGKQLSVPREFFDISLKASFDSDPQANITTDEFTFVLSSYKEVQKWISEGLLGGVGIFEGIPIQISASGRGDSVKIFDGFLDLQDDIKIFPNKDEVKATLKQSNGLNQLSDLIEPLDFGYLLDIGVITQSDYNEIEYVVVKLDITVDAITALITAYLLGKQLQDTIKELATTIGTISSLAVSGITGTVGAAVYAIVIAIAQAIYAAALLVLLVQLGIDLFNLFISPRRTHKCISLKTLIEKTCNHIGYELNTSIDDLDFVNFLPSNTNVDTRGGGIFIQTPGTIKQGIPNITDFGYTCTEAFQLVRDLFNARFSISEDKVQLHSENSDYWIKNSSWIKPTSMQDVKSKIVRYNTRDIRSSININFQTDVVDEYTIENFKGTAYQVLTDAITVNNPRHKTIKNLDIVSIPCALASRKNQLTGFENLIADLARVFDQLSGIFGGRANLEQRVKNRVGVMKVSNNNHSIPKLIYLKGNNLPENHRDLFSAKALYEKYHIEKSFVANGGERQRVLSVGERIPFGFDDFVKVINNSYFKDENGILGKITELEWNMSNDYAIISYWQQQNYTNNLTETFIEP